MMPSENAGHLLRVGVDMPGQHCAGRKRADLCDRLLEYAPLHVSLQDGPRDDLL